MHSRGVLALAMTAVAAVLGSGCATQTAPRTSRGGRRVRAGTLRREGQDACRLLAPETRSQLVQAAGEPCASAILEEELPEPGPVERSSSFGTMAEITYAADTMFLTEFPGGWKVMAAGCAPVPGHPYDCRLQGG